MTPQEEAFQGIEIERGAPRIVRILVALDGSAASNRALAWAGEMAALHHAHVTAVHVMPVPGVYAIPHLGPGAPMPDEIYAREREAAQDLLVGAVGQLKKRGVPATYVLAHGSPVKEIVDLARKEKCDLIVLGAGKSSLVERLLLGSVADGVKNHAACSILLAKEMPPPSAILVAVDGSRESKRAASLSGVLAPAWKAHVTVLHVVEPPPWVGPELPEAILKQAEPGLTVANRGKLADFAVDRGRAAPTIVKAAATLHAGLIILGSRGLGSLETLIVGSVSNTVAHTSPVSVLLVKEVTP